MFKKLFKSEASSRNNKVDILTSMGFNRNLAESALVASNGNVEEATNILLSQGSLIDASATSSPLSSTNNGQMESE